MTILDRVEKALLLYKESPDEVQSSLQRALLDALSAGDLETFGDIFNRMLDTAGIPSKDVYYSESKCKTAFPVLFAYFNSDIGRNAIHDAIAVAASSGENYQTLEGVLYGLCRCQQTEALLFFLEVLEPFDLACDNLWATFILNVIDTIGRRGRALDVVIEKVFKLIVEDKHIDISVRDANGRSLLAEAEDKREHQHFSTIRWVLHSARLLWYLYQHGVKDLEAIIMIRAVEDEDQNVRDELLKWLKDGQADLNSLIPASDFRGSMLHFAARNDRLETVTRLLEYGADVNVRDSLGRTPLFGCSKPCAELLLRHGANVDSADNQGRQAIHLGGRTYSGGFKTDIVQVQHTSLAHVLSKVHLPNACVRVLSCVTQQVNRRAAGSARSQGRHQLPRSPRHPAARQRRARRR
jgi:hypothetical protein